MKALYDITCEHENSGKRLPAASHIEQPDDRIKSTTIISSALGLYNLAISMPFADAENGLK